MTNHKESLAQRAEVLQKEIVELQKQFELKKEEFLKVQGALEMLQVIEKDATASKINISHSIDYNLALKNILITFVL